ncbi:MAG: TetR/AcrR family transcriptional regulator [Paracoccaceae bacterium]|nr:TetR/AcrR family transcriptional regulator [Paracoccaceae bacterium]MDG2259287.1 TetR/AcrR family transcriptional regulator [Paracoccaceae bacterium]
MARTIAKDHDQKKSRILKTAARVFAEEGFDRASVSRLARECGISKANIYHYYDSKDALLFDLLDTNLSELLTRMQNVNTDGLSPEEALEFTLGEILLAYDGKDYEHQIQSSAMIHLPKQQQATLKGYQKQMIERVANLLEAVNSTCFEGNPEKLNDTTMSIFGMLNWFYMWNAHAGPEKRKDYARLVTGLTLSGISGI